MRDEEETPIKIQVNPKTFKQVTVLDDNFSKVVSEALDLWLKKRMLTCPLTNDICPNIQGQCNECSITKR